MNTMLAYKSMRLQVPLSAASQAIHLLLQSKRNA
jgi:hypothetical protein